MYKLLIDDILYYFLNIFITAYQSLSIAYSNILEIIFIIALQQFFAPNFKAFNLVNYICVTQILDISECKISRNRLFSPPPKITILSHTILR